MKDLTKEIMSFGDQAIPVTITSVPETEAEFDANAGEAGACVAAATDHIIFHRTLGAAREQFAQAVEKKTGIQRKSEQTTKKDGTPGKPKITEPVAKFFARVLQETGTQVLDYRDCAPSVAFTAAVTERGEGGGKVPKGAIEAAQGLLNDSDRDRKLAKLEELYPDVYENVIETDDSTGLPTEDSLARVLHHHRKAIEARVKAEAAAALG